MEYFIFVVVFIILLIVVQHYAEYDDTDNKADRERSGLILYIDHRTGLHYLRGGFFGGGIIPRLDENGKQIRDTKGIN